MSVLLLTPILTTGCVANSRQRGFTLLEIVLVLFLIGLLASAGLLFTEGLEDQAKYDETKRRMELIRKAIIGDPTRTINGAPEISGFVADMGRLPFCLAELLTPGAMSGVPADNTFISPCSEDSNIIAIQGWQRDADTSIGYGWRGPYIQTLADRDGVTRFRDGYGNVDIDVDEDNKNFGWNFTISTATSSVQLQSAGFDPVSPADDFPQTASGVAPDLIINDGWKITSLDVVFKNVSGDALPNNSSDILLRVYTSQLTDYVDGSPSDLDFITLAASSVLPETSLIETFVFTEPEAIAQGVRAYAVVCHENPPTDPDDFAIFNGDCGTSTEKPSSSTIRTFSAIPRNSLNLQLDWIIPIP